MATPVKGRAPTPKLRATTPKLPDVSGETIAVQAGHEIIYVHKRLISNSSDFFKNATKPQWKTESSPIDLSDERSSIFKKYCQWLYSGLIAPECTGDKTGNSLAYMYVLGEKIVDYEFQNAVIDAIVTCIIQRNTAPNLGFVKIIYDGTTEGSIARRLLVDVWARRITSTWKKDSRELLKPDFEPFLKDLFPAILDEPLARDTIKRNWIPRPELYRQKVVALRSSVAEKKDDEINTDRVNQDGITGSILDKTKDYQFTFTLPGNSSNSTRFSAHYSLQSTDLTVPVSPQNKMATATIAACDTATIVLVAPPEDFEMPSLRGDLVPVQIGSNETSPLHVHTTILTKNSEFFKNAMKPECRADSTKPINVPNVMLTIFEAYCGWLYTGKIVHHMKDQRYRFLASLYVLGETLMDTAFQDVIVAATIRYSIDYKTFPGNRPLQIIYAGTPANSPARRLMVDFWMFRAHPTWEGLGHLTKTTCTDFVNDLVRELVMKRDIPTSFAQRPWVANPESYRVDGEAK